MSAPPPSLGDEESVSILIPTHNRAPILARTLDSLAHVRVPPGAVVELIVVANACTDDTPAVVAARATQFVFPARCVDEPEVGLNVARNRAVREAKGNILALLDDDVRLDPGWLEAMLETYRTRPADIVAGQVSLWWDTTPRPAWMTFNLEGALSKLEMGPDVMESTNYMTAIGANFSFRRSAYERAGAFLPGLDRVGTQMLSGGESEFIRRAMAAGARLFYSPGMHVGHWVAPHRATPQYVQSVWRGFGMSMVFARQPFGPWEILKQSLGRAAMATWEGMAVLGLRLRGKDATERRARRSYHLGAVRATVLRLTGKSPVAKQPRAKR